MFFDRPDGELLRDASPLRRLMPLLMPGRNEAAVYFEQTLDLTETLRWLQAREAAGGAPKISFFVVVLAAMVRALAERPGLNRFVAGGRLWQRKRIEISFAVKKEMSDGANMTTVKVAFEPGDDVARVAERVEEAIQTGRGKQETTSETEMSLATRLPGAFTSLILRGLRLLDGLNLLPAAMLRNDPLYASLFVANLGSVGLDAPFHHLFEHGTVPMFATIGRIQKLPVVDDDGQVRARDAVRIRYTYDERINDGFYAARSLELFKAWVEDPRQLEKRGTVSQLRVAATRR